MMSSEANGQQSDGLKDDGYTLVELVVVLLLTILLMTALIQFYAQVRSHHHRLVNDLSSEALYLDAYLSRLIANAGYFATFTRRPNQIRNHTAKTPTPLTIQANGFEFWTADQVLGVLSRDTTTPMGSTEMNVLQLNTRNTKRNDFIFIDDGLHAELVSVRQVQGKRVTLNSPLVHPFDSGTRVYRLNHFQFYFDAPQSKLFEIKNGRKMELSRDITLFQPTRHHRMLQVKMTFSDRTDFLNWDFYFALRNSNES